MSVYKEGYYAIDQIVNASRQVWVDACDFGAPTVKGDRLWNFATFLASAYGDRTSRIVQRYSTGATTRILIRLGSEDGEVVNRFSLTYTKCQSHKGVKGFLTVEPLSSN